MTTAQRIFSASSALALLLAAGAATPAVAQEPASAQLAQQLTEQLEKQKLDSVAARHPSAADEYVAALFFPGQLLVIQARTEAPAVINEKLVRREFRDVYIDLNSASVVESRVMFTDGNADGMRATREPNKPFDMYDAAGKSILFDGNWREDRMSEKDYMAAYEAAEKAYAAALTALLTELKKPS